MFNEFMRSDAIFFDFPDGCKQGGGNLFLKTAKRCGKTPFQHCQRKHECPRDLQAECCEQSEEYKKND